MGRHSHGLGPGENPRSKPQRRTSRAVRRVLSPGRPRGGRETAIHLGPALPPASCGLPADSGGQPSNVRAGPPFEAAPLDLAPGGVYLAARVTPGAGGLLHHRFTLTGDRASPAVCFLWHCPAGHPGWALPTTLPCGARTFLGRIPRDLHAAVRPARLPCRPWYRWIRCRCAASRRSARPGCGARTGRA